MGRYYPNGVPEAIAANTACLLALDFTFPLPSISLTLPSLDFTFLFPSLPVYCPLD